MSHPIDPRHLAEGKRVADQMMEAAFGRGVVREPVSEVELIRRHYGDFTGLYDQSQAVAHVRILLAALAAVEQERGRLTALIGRLVEELEDLAIASCWTGNFKGCDNGGCVERRALIAEARIAIADPLTDLIGIAPDRDESEAEPFPIAGQEEPEWLVWSNAQGAWWGPNSAGYRQDVMEAGRYTEAEALKAINMRTWDKHIPPEVMVLAPSQEQIVAMVGTRKLAELMRQRIDEATQQRIREERAGQ